MSEAVGDPRVDHFLSLLERERSASELTGTQRLVYLLLHVSTIGWAAFLLLAGGTLVAWESAPVATVAPLFIGFLSCSALLGYLTPVALLLNTPLLIKAVLRWRRLRELGLERYASVPWRDKVLLKLPLDWLGGLFLLFGFLLSLSVVLAMFELERTLPGLVTAWLFATGLASIGFYFIRRGRARLEFIQEIAALESIVRGPPELAQDGYGYERLPAAAVEQLRRLERNSIRREREQSILESLSPDGEPRYAVQKSRAALTVQERLPAERRVVLDSTLQQLMIDPHSASPSHLSATPELVVLRTDLGLTIEYDVDELRRVVRVHAIHES